MVNTSYKESLKKISTALLMDRLIQETNGLSSEEIEKIAKWNWYEKDVLIPISSLTMDIKVCTMEEFAEAATLAKTGTVHDWAGDSTLIQYGDWILGEGTFGVHKNMTYTNGHQSSTDKENSLPDFHTDRHNAILIKTEDTESFNGRNDYEESWNIYILLKGGELQIDDKIKRIMEDFNI